VSKYLINIGSFWEIKVEKMELEGVWEIDDAILGWKLGKSRKERKIQLLLCIFAPHCSGYLAPKRVCLAWSTRPTS
jgi:hypothetical protein